MIWEDERSSLSSAVFSLQMQHNKLQSEMIEIQNEIRSTKQTLVELKRVLYGETGLTFSRREGYRSNSVKSIRREHATENADHVMQTKDTENSENRRTSLSLGRSEFPKSRAVYSSKHRHCGSLRGTMNSVGQSSPEGAINCKELLVLYDVFLCLFILS